MRTKKQIEKMMIGMLLGGESLPYQHGVIS